MNKTSLRPIEFVVGIGFSAGGLEAIEHFFHNFPKNTEISVVVISHLDPNRHSYLVELITSYTQMSVQEVKDGQQLYPNVIYVIPPGKSMIVQNRIFHLESKVKDKKKANSIDTFFSSMAKDYKNKSVGVILSGTGDDGAEGLQEISDNNGLTFVQKPESAKFDSMPRSAINAGNIDHILLPNEISKEVIQHYNFLKSSNILDRSKDQEDIFLKEIYSIIKKVSGIDFSQYKKSPFLRHIHRHMDSNSIKKDDSYLNFLRKSKIETSKLYESILIGVTAFFRNPETFSYLGKKIIPQIIKKNKKFIRVWICGCSTGEEAYTIAMLIKEQSEHMAPSTEVKIFATDINAKSINIARKGKFPHAIKDQVPARFLEKYFTQEGDSYLIKSEIRSMVIFATHNIATDSTFSHMDLTCCRNLLIYLKPELQKRVMSLLTYSLSQSGHLLLGNAESIGEFSPYYKTRSSKHKIFQLKATKSTQTALIESLSRDRVNNPLSYKGLDRSNRMMNFENYISKFILSKLAPVGVVVNDNNDVIYYHGKTADFLEPETGRINLNIFNLLRGNLRAHVCSALQRARTEKTTIYSNNLQMTIKDVPYIVNLIVSPIQNIEENNDENENHCLILFDKTIEKDGSQETKKTTNGKVNEINKYKDEISSLKAFYSSQINTLESARENDLHLIDKLQTTNEELQSSNEELETSREELQAVYEELQNIVSEQDRKLKYLTNAEEDMNNLLASTKIGTIFLSDDLIIKRFTPAIKNIVQLKLIDIGRSLSDFSSCLNYEELSINVKKVLASSNSYNNRITTNEGITFHMCIHPYKTVDNKVHGVVVTFIDITNMDL